MAVTPFFQSRYATPDTAPLIPQRSQTDSQSGRLATWGLAIVEVIIGYEWLLSALNKMLSPQYRPGFVDALQQMSTANNPNGWWVSYVHQQVFPWAGQWATIVEVGELLVALGFFAGAILWVSKGFPSSNWAITLNIGVIVAIVGGVLMTASYYLMAGHTLPWLNPADPFDEGLSLDGLLTGIGLGLLLIHLIALWIGDIPHLEAYLKHRESLKHTHR